MIYKYIKENFSLTKLFERKETGEKREKMMEITKHFICSCVFKFGYVDIFNYVDRNMSLVQSKILAVSNRLRYLYLC